MSKLANSNSDTSVRPTEGRPPNTPRWVKVSGIIVISLVLLLIIMKLAGVGGDHGPGRHIPSTDQTPSGDHTVPKGGH